MSAALLCRHCGHGITPDDVNGWQHTESGLAGCGKPFADEERYAEPKPCFWCKSTEPDHQHYTVIIRERGKLLGRLTPDGYTTNRKVHAAMMSRTTADRVAAEINAAGQFTAKVAPF